MVTRKLTFGVATLLLAGLLYASPFERRELILNDLTSSSARVVASEPLTVGESGIVVRSFGPNEMVVVARGSVTLNDAQGSIIRFSPYQGLEQTSLPHFIASPQAGDKLILHPFGKRSLILAPSFDAYQKASLLIQDADLIHPDHFATYLLSRYNPIPTKEDISRFCEGYSVEFLYIALSNGSVQMRECSTLALLQTPTTSTITTRPAQTVQKLPFYHRVAEIKRGLFDFGTNSINDFDTYYLKLLGESK